MSSNPYQAPTDVGQSDWLTLDDLVLGLQTTPKKMQRHLAALRTIRYSYYIPVMMTPVFFLLGYVGGYLFLATTTIWFFVSLMASTRWATTGGRYQALVFVSLTLQTLSGMALFLFLRAGLSGQASSGLLVLFGASAFAALMISQALIAMVIRGISDVTKNRFANVAASIAIIGFATVAGAASLTSLQAFWGYGDIALMIGLVSFLCASIGMIIAATSATQSLKNAMNHASTDL